MTLADVFRHVDTLDGDPWPTIRRAAPGSLSSLKRDRRVYELVASAQTTGPGEPPC